MPQENQDATVCVGGWHPLLSHEAPSVLRGCPWGAPSGLGLLILLVPLVCVLPSESCVLPGVQYPHHHPPGFAPFLPTPGGPGGAVGSSQLDQGVDSVSALPGSGSWGHGFMPATSLCSSLNMGSRVLPMKWAQHRAGLRANAQNGCSLVENQ